MATIEVRIAHISTTPQAIAGRRSTCRSLRSDAVSAIPVEAVITAQRKGPNGCHPQGSIASTDPQTTALKARVVRRSSRPADGKPHLRCSSGSPSDAERMAGRVGVDPVTFVGGEVWDGLGQTGTQGHHPRRGPSLTIDVHEGT